jgi:hypothetical protein
VEADSLGERMDVKRCFGCFKDAEEREPRRVGERPVARSSCLLSAQIGHGAAHPSSLGHVCRRPARTSARRTGTRRRSPTMRSGRAHSCLYRGDRSLGPGQRSLAVPPLGFRCANYPCAKNTVRERRRTAPRPPRDQRSGKFRFSRRPDYRRHRVRHSSPWYPERRRSQRPLRTDRSLRWCPRP